MTLRKGFFILLTITISISSLTIHDIYADEFSYCLENTTQSQSWQKQLCFESVICKVPTPIILFDNETLNFDIPSTIQNLLYG